jgi:hypothetical protein
MPLSALFDAMNARPESSGIEQWALRQTTMEEVFLRIARESEAEPSGSVGGSREQARVVSHCRV